MKSNKIMKWVIPLIVVGVIFGVPFLFMGGFLNPWLGFLEPVLCPDGMHLSQGSEAGVDADGDKVVRFTTNCTDGKEEVDITWKMILILLAVGVIMVVIFFLVPMDTSPKEPEKIQFDID